MPAFETHSGTTNVTATRFRVVFEFLFGWTFAGHSGSGTAGIDAAELSTTPSGFIPSTTITGSFAFAGSVRWADRSGGAVFWSGRVLVPVQIGGQTALNLDSNVNVTLLYKCRWTREEFPCQGSTREILHNERFQRETHSCQGFGREIVPDIPVTFPEFSEGTKGQWRR
jgi:hypothetical protein